MQEINQNIEQAKDGLRQSLIPLVRDGYSYQQVFELAFDVLVKDSGISDIVLREDIKINKLNEIKNIVLGMLESGLTDDKLAVFIENSVIFAVMEYTGGNQVKAAKVLGWSRGTLRTKLTSYFGTTQLGGVFQRSLKKFRKRKQVIDNLCVRED